MDVNTIMLIAIFRLIWVFMIAPVLTLMFIAAYLLNKEKEKGWKLFRWWVGVVLLPTLFAIYMYDIFG